MPIHCACCGHGCEVCQHLKPVKGLEIDLRGELADQDEAQDPGCHGD